MIDITGMNI